MDKLSVWKRKMAKEKKRRDFYNQDLSKFMMRVYWDPE